MNTTSQPELIPKNAGDVLRQARENRHWTVEFVAQAIKVKPEVLVSIEKGDTSHIPPVYLKGYVRGYARELGIPQNVIDEYLSLGQEADPEVQSIFKEGAPRENGDRWFKASSYVLASAVVIALVWQFTNEAVRFSQGDPLLRPTQTESDTSFPSEQAARDDRASTSLVTEAPLAKRHLRASIASMSGPQEQITSNRPLVAEGAWAAIGKRDAATNAADSPPAGMDTLEIFTSADSWVEITGRDDEKVEMDLLRAGSKRVYRAAAPFHVLLGRASSVEVILNGEKVNIAPYVRGNVARLTLGGKEPDSQPAATSDAESSAMETASPDKG